MDGAKIYQLGKIQPETHATPRVRFTWGAPPKPRAFTAVVESVTVR